MNPESFDTLLDALRPVRRRWQAVRVAQAAISGLWIGSIGLCLVALGRRFGADWSDALWAMPLVAATAMAIWRLVQPPDWNHLASVIDHRYQFKDRTSTALSLARRGHPRAIERLQLRDAQRHLADVQPELIVPWKFPPRLAYGAGLWLVALAIASAEPVSVLPHPVASRQLRTDTVHREVAERIEGTVIRELRRLAAETVSMPARRSDPLQSLADDVEHRLQTLKQPGTTSAESLATLSAIQAEIAKASRQIADAQTLANLQSLSRALASSDQWQTVAEMIARGDLQRAADALRRTELAQLTPLEQRTLSADLLPVAEELREARADLLATAIQSLHDGLELQDADRFAAAARGLADALEQQGGQMALQSALNQQLEQVAEAKGLAQSGGDHVARSDESRQTWGQGRAGDPLAEPTSLTAATRHGETLSGTAGEGPTHRETIRAPGDASPSQRPLQPTLKEWDVAVEQVLRKEPLPAGYRQTIRRYFQSIRPAE